MESSYQMSLTDEIALQADQISQISLTSYHNSAKHITGGMSIGGYTKSTSKFNACTPMMDISNSASSHKKSETSAKGQFVTTKRRKVDNMHQHTPVSNILGDNVKTPQQAKGTVHYVSKGFTTDTAQQHHAIDLPEALLSPQSIIKNQALAKNITHRQRHSPTSEVDNFSTDFPELSSFSFPSFGDSDEFHDQFENENQAVTTNNTNIPVSSQETDNMAATPVLSRNRQSLKRRSSDQRSLLHTPHIDSPMVTPVSGRTRRSDRFSGVRPNMQFKPKSTVSCQTTSTGSVRVSITSTTPVASTTSVTPVASTTSVAPVASAILVPPVTSTTSVLPVASTTSVTPVASTTSVTPVDVSMTTPSIAITTPTNALKNIVTPIHSTDHNSSNVHCLVEASQTSSTLQCPNIAYATDRHNIASSDAPLLSMTSQTTTAELIDLSTDVCHTDTCVKAAEETVKDAPSKLTDNIVTPTEMLVSKPRKRRSTSDFEISSQIFSPTTPSPTASEDDPVNLESLPCRRSKRLKRKSLELYQKEIRSKRSGRGSGSLSSSQSTDKETPTEMANVALPNTMAHNCEMKDSKNTCEDENKIEPLKLEVTPQKLEVTQEDDVQLNDPVEGSSSEQYAHIVKDKDDSDDTIISEELRDLYYNRSWREQMPPETRPWQTIYERPRQSGYSRRPPQIFGKEEVSREIDFDNFYSHERIQSRHKRALKQGYKMPTKRKFKQLQVKLEKVLRELDETNADGSEGTSTEPAKDTKQPKTPKKRSRRKSTS